MMNCLMLEIAIVLWDLAHTHVLLLRSGWKLKFLRFVGNYLRGLHGTIGSLIS